MNTLDKQYTDLLQDILDNGVKKEDRTGTGTLSVFGRTIRHKMSDGFPAITTKKLHFKSVVSELLWFLQGRTDLRYLLENDCHIWTGDAYKVYDKDFDREYSPFSSPYPKRLTKSEFEKKIVSDDDFNKKYGDLGPIYGKQWRSWDKYEQYRMLDTKGNRFYGKEQPIDQIQNLINDIKKNPDSRRLMVSAWNPLDLGSSVLPPCHYGFQVYTRELSLEERSFIPDSNHNEVSQNIKMFTGVDEDHTLHKYLDNVSIPTRAISLIYNARSQDVPLGTPFNISSYALLLEIIGKMVNMIPDELIANMGDCHIYLNQIDGVKEQIGRELTIEERIDLASEKYENFDVMDFGIPFTCTHDNIYLDKYYPVPRNTREPFPLPSLKHLKTDDFYKSLSEDLSLLTHLDNTDFIIENYQSHPSIKIPLSN